MPEQEQSQGELRMVEPDQIETRDGFNPRTTLDQERLDELTASIRQRGSNGRSGTAASARRRWPDGT